MLTDSQLLLVALFVQALLYGIYLATLIQCFRWLIFSDEGWKLRERINHVMTFATIFIFTMSTINLVTTLTFEINKYLRRGESWNDYGTVMTMNVTEVLGTISVDSVLIYRCWVVYGKSLRAICVPVTVWLASLACSAVFCYFGALNYKPQTFSNENVEISLKTYTGLYACNIAITVYTTTAIIYRILSTRQNSAGSPKRLNYVVRVLAESGILYTSMMIFSVVGLFVMQRNDVAWVDLLIADISEPLAFSTAGITFNLLLIRVYQNRAELRHSSVESKDVYEERTLPGGHSNNPQITASLSEGPSFNMANTLYDAIDEIQERRRSAGMHEN